jgi:flagellar hook-length control protein FliK
MQTASVMGLGAPKAKEAAPDGKGLHISAARPHNPGRSVFNKILSQGLAPKRIALQFQAADAEQGETSGQEPSGDNIPAEMGALLMQLNMMGAAAPAADAAAEAAVEAAAGKAEAVTGEIVPVALTGGETAEMTAEMSIGEPAAFRLTPSGEEAPPQAGTASDETAGAARILREIAAAMAAQEEADAVPPADVGPEATADTDGVSTAAVQESAAQPPLNTAAAVSTDRLRPADNPAPAEAVLTAEAEQMQKPDGAAGARDTGAITETGPGLPDAAVYTAQTAKAFSDDGDTGGADGQQAGNEDTPAVALTAPPGMTAAPGGKQEVTAPEATAAEKAAAADKAFLRLTDDVRGLQAGRHEISIQLEPESLGTLTISVVKTERGISATIRAEDKELCALMTDRLQQLISSMKTKGIGVQDVEVLHTPDERSMDFSKQAFSQHREQASGGRGAPRDHRQSRPSEPAPAQVASAGDSEDTTVEYRV